MVALVIGMQAWQMVPSMFGHDEVPDYYHFVLPFVFQCDVLEYPQIDSNNSKEPLRNPIKWWLNCASWNWFGYAKILPVAFNIAIMPLVYLLGSYITKDRMIGLLALSAFLMNPLYNDWKTNGTYDQTWAFFLLLSLVLMFRFKNSGMAYISYLVSIAAKTLNVLYFPLWLYTFFKTDKPLKSKILNLILFFVVITAGLLAANSFGINLVGNTIGFYPEHWEQALFRNISLLWQVIPALMAVGGINAVFHAKNKPMNKKLVLLWMLGIILTTPIIHLFTNQLTFTYRFVPFAAFMSIFIAMTIVELGNFLVESRLKTKLVSS